MANEEVYISLSGKQLVAGVAAVVALIGAFPVANLVAPARYDPFTGSDGAALETRIHHLEEWKEQHMQWGRDLSNKQGQKDATQDANIQELYRRIP